MSARDVIARALLDSMALAHRTTENGWGNADAILSALSAAGWVVVPREIQETPIEAAFWAAEYKYKALIAANVWPRPIRAVYIWDALLTAAALPAGGQR